MKRWLAIALLAFLSTASAQWQPLWPPVSLTQPPEAPKKDAPITLYGEVNAKSAGDVIDAIHAANKLGLRKPILLFLNSPGGSVLSGNMIIDAMESSRRPVVTINVGLCASMCAIAFEHGHRRLTTRNAILMLHEASAGTEGDLSHMASQVMLWMRVVARHERYIADRAGMPVEVLRAHEQSQWWLLSEDAIDAHLADAIISPSDYPAPRE